VDHGGFVITSKEHCVKQVTGWARYCLSVEAEAEVTLEVNEEASYDETISMTENGIISFLAARAKPLVEQGILCEDIVRSLRRTQAQLRLRAMLVALEKPLSITEEDVISWEEKESDHTLEFRALLAQDPKRSDEYRGLIAQVRELHRMTAKKKELQRKQSVRNSRVTKIFENQSRLRENIKSMEHVRTGTLLERYMSDMDKEENELIQTRKEIENADEEIANTEQEISRHVLQITMKTKQMRDKFS